MGVNCAACEYGVPRSTLKDRLSSRAEHGKKSGPRPYPTSQEEDDYS